MPLYEFECADCRQRIEILVRSTGEEPSCPKCGGTKLTRLLSAFNTSGGGGEGAHSHAGGGCSCCPQGPSCPMSGRGS